MIFNLSNAKRCHYKDLYLILFDSKHLYVFQFQSQSTFLFRVDKSCSAFDCTGAEKNGKRDHSELVTINKVWLLSRLFTSAILSNHHLLLAIPTSWSLLRRSCYQAAIKMEPQLSGWLRAVGIRNWVTNPGILVAISFSVKDVYHLFA